MHGKPAFTAEGFKSGKDRLAPTTYRRDIRMGMSTYVMGFKPPEETRQRMTRIYDACTEGGIAIPDEVQRFFGYEDPDPSGVEVDLGEAVQEYRAEMREGYEIRVADIPDDVAIIRFFNSY